MTAGRRPSISHCSRKNLPHLPSKPYRVGIDTIKVFGPLARVPDFSKFSRVKTRSSYGPDESWPLEGTEDLGGVRFTARRYSPNGPSAGWEVSLPTSVNGTNIEPMPVEEALSYLLDTFVAAESRVAWACEFEDLQVSRIDLDRDFRGVDQISDLLEGLQRVRLPKKAAQRGPWSSNDGMHALSVQVPKRWKAQLYDKHAQLWSVRSEGDAIKRAAIARVLPEVEDVLRFECRLWRPCTVGQGLATLGDLSNERIEQINRHYFDLCGFGTPIGGPGRLQEIMRDSLESSTSQDVAKAIGLLHFDAASLPGPFSEPTNRKYRKMARELTVSPANLGADIESTIRLNYDEGTLEPSGYETPLAVAA